MRRAFRLTICCMVPLFAACVQTGSPPRAGLPEAAVPQAELFTGCGIAFALPSGWRMREVEPGQRWQLDGAGEHAPAVSVQCLPAPASGPDAAEVLRESGPVDPSRMRRDIEVWEAHQGDAVVAIPAYQLIDVPGTQVREVAMVMWPLEPVVSSQQRPALANALIALRWHSDRPRQLEQRKAFIASLTQSIHAPGTAPGINGTAP
ncbi:hypothetical protein [Pseudoxanthomonas beigongshangi]